MLHSVSLASSFDVAENTSGTTSTPCSSRWASASILKPPTGEKQQKSNIIINNNNSQHQRPQQQLALPSIVLPTVRESLVTHVSTLSDVNSKEAAGKKDSKKKDTRRRLPKINQDDRGGEQRAALCRQWIASHRAEQTMMQKVVDIARELFYDAIVRCNYAIVADGYDQMRLLAVKTAVSCFLLEEIVKTLPRYEILQPSVGMLLRAVYVPDTAEMREALGGTVEYPFLLYDFPTDSAARTLLARYARKTYFIAHHELTQRVIAQAHANASQLQHFKRLPRVFALMNTNWIKSFLRIILKSWSHVCRVRRQSEQKHRARWARRFAAERIRSTVRRWRVYANIRLQGAAAAENMKGRIELIKANTRRLENEISVLTESSAELSAKIEEKGNLHVSLEKRIAELEQEYKRKLEFVREIDRVGSRLLDSLLLKKQFPPRTETLSCLELLVLWANTTLLESPFGSLFVATTDNDFAIYIDNVRVGREQKNNDDEKPQIVVSDVGEEDLPFTPLLNETTTVYLPMHRFLALIRVLDYESGPTKDQMKMVCTSDIRIRSLRSKMENNDEPAEMSSSEAASVLELEKTVGQTVVEAYETLTGGTCPVTVEQLMSRKRGIQLVFLASIFRYFTNWMENQVRKQQLSTEEPLTANVTISSVEIDVSGAEKKEETLAQDNHLGVRDRKFVEWYHPPQNHIYWLSRVENQRNWIAASLSALHEALHVAVKDHVIIPVEVQEETNEFLENVTLSRLSDILPREAITSSTYFIRLARVVEDALPKLRALFMEYAQQDVVVEPDRNNNKTGSNAPRGSGKRKNEQQQQNNDNNTESGPFYMTVFDFWRLLRDCRAIGAAGKLHRAVVRQITGNVLGSKLLLAESKRQGESRSAAMARKHARSLMISAEIDVKSSHYKLHLSAAEFIEMLLRCARAWDSLRQQEQERYEEELMQRRMTGCTETLSVVCRGNSSSTESTASDARENEIKICYDMADTTWPLRPDAVREFFHECIIAHGFRGPTLDPFRRAMRHAKVRAVFSSHHDLLFSIFTHYAVPKEARGMVTQPLDMNSSMRKLLERTASLGQSTTRESLSSISVTAQNNTVGIVRVMTADVLHRMATDFGWYRIRRVTTTLLEGLFTSVGADGEHEPDVVFFPEWIDLLCAVTCYHDPNPTRPLYEKVPHFLEEYVLAFSRTDSKMK